MNIGITLGLQEEYESMWINGIKLNVLNLVETLSQIEGYNVYALDTSNKVSDVTKVSWDRSKYPIYKFNDKLPSTDLLIMLGTSYTGEQIKKFKAQHPNLKIIKYYCGNNYVIDMERILFPVEKEINPTWSFGHDQTWYIPQQEFHNKGYYKTIGRHSNKDVWVVPFVWSPYFIEKEDKENIKLGHKSARYSPGKSAKECNLVSMEPNMNVVKFCMPLIIMAEEIYRKRGKDAFNEFWIGSGKRLLDNKYFISCIKNLDITNSGKLKLCSRYPVNVFLSEKADIVVSHQWDNPLNYAYLDILYFGYPLIHNATMIKDAGYYYEGYDTDMGARLLDSVLNHRDEFLEQYNLNSDRVLSRYLTVNPKIVETYKKLIENVFEPGKHHLSNEYNWETNLYK